MLSLTALAVGIALVAFGLHSVYDRAVVLGLFRDAHAVFHNAGHLQQVTNTINCEDLHYDERTGHIFAACQGTDHSRAKWFPPLQNFADPSAGADGELRTIDPKTFKSEKLRLEGFNDHFTTHGIDVIHDPKDPSAVYILAVNHPPSAEYVQSRNTSLPAERKASSRIEIFRHVLDSTTAQHVRTVQHELIKTPNDIFATGPLSFYVTNDHFYREGIMRLLEDVGTRKVAAWSDTIYVDVDDSKSGSDGVFAHVALTGLHNNNGLGHGPDDTVLITDSVGGVTYFAHEEDGHMLKIDGELTSRNTIDNPAWFVDVYAENDGEDKSGLLNAGLGNALDLMEAVQSGAPIASRITLDTGSLAKGWNRTELFIDDGRLLNSASAAVLVPVDPASNEGKKQAWLFASGFASAAVLAVKVDLAA